MESGKLDDTEFSKVAGGTFTGNGSHGLGVCRICGRSGKYMGDLKWHNLDGNDYLSCFNSHLSKDSETKLPSPWD